MKQIKFLKIFDFKLPEFGLYPVWQTKTHLVLFGTFVPVEVHIHSIALVGSSRFVTSQVLAFDSWTNKNPLSSFIFIELILVVEIELSR